MRLLRRLWFLLRQRRFEADLAEELQSHREMITRELTRGDMSPSEATAAAASRFGSSALALDEARDVWLARWIQAFVQDARHAARGLRKEPLFATIAVLTLTLGLGANTAMFSIVRAVLLKPLPYRAAENLVIVEAWWQPGSRRQRTNYSAADLARWQASARSFESVALSYSGLQALASDDGAEMLNSIAATPAFFSTLQGDIVLGRALGPADDRLPVGVISERLWRRKFAAAPSAIGQTIALSTGGATQTFTIVGVAGASFQFPSARADVWIPAGFFVTTVFPPAGEPRAGGFNVVGRLSEGATLEAAQADADRISALLNADRPADERMEAVVIGLRDSTVNAVRPALVVLFGAAALVLCVACVNVANLLLARGASRTRELAIRRAIGASGERLMGQAIVEAGVLAALGVAGGLAFAWIAIRLVSSLGAAAIPRAETIHLDRQVLGFALVMGAVATLAAGVLPALQAARAHDLRGRFGLSTGPEGRKVRHALVVAEIAISLVLVIGATLLSRSLANLMAPENVGITGDGVVAGEINLQMGRALTAAQQIALVDRLTQRLDATPSVISAGVGNGLPPSGLRMNAFIEHPDPATGVRRTFQFSMVPISPGFLEALGVPLIHGRRLTDADRMGRPGVMLVSASAARDLFGTTDAVDRTIDGPAFGDEAKAIRIVGVVADVKYSGLEGERRSVIYRPFAQFPFRNVFITARVTGDPRAAVPSLRRAIADVDASLTISSLKPLEQFLGDAAAQPRFRTSVMLVLAGLAAMLAIVGMYGVIAFAVTQRTHEIGVRIALGADGARVMQLVMREGVWLAAIGTLLGTVAAYALSRMMSGFLFQLTPTDVVSFGFAIGLLLTVSVLATLIPAYRAMTVDPLVALRCD